MDSASFSAHKFGGPRGVGCLYLKDPKSIVNVTCTGGLQEDSMRSGTENLAGIAGMTKALELSLCHHKPNWKAALLKNIEQIEQKRDRLQKKLTSYFADKEGVQFRVNGNPPTNKNKPSYCTRLYNTLSFSQDLCDNKCVVDKLRERGICLSVGSACSKSNGSKTLEQIQLSKKMQDGTFRIALSHRTTNEDVDTAFDVISKLLDTKYSAKARPTGRR